MEKVKQWVETDGALTLLNLDAKLLILGRKGEGYEASFKSGRLHIRADSPLAAAYALHQASLFNAAGHLADYMGACQPKFPMRALWFNPACINEDNTERLCQRTIELGYNTWIVGAYDEGMFAVEPSQSRPCKGLHNILKQYGLKLVIKPQIIRAFGDAAVCPLDQTYQQELASALNIYLQECGGCDALFWESACLSPGFENTPAVRDYLQSDLVLKEVAMLEEVLGGKQQLIYYMPAADLEDAYQRSQWMSMLCDAAGKNTIIAFPAVAGKFWGDHLPPHPFWNVLRYSSEASATKLMPVLNCGGFDQGEGLWPSLPLDLIETYIPRCYRHFFAGMAVSCPALPAEGSFLEGGLWVASQAQWRNLQPALLAETWYGARRSRENYYASNQKMEEIREIIREISSLRALVSQNSRSLLPSAESRARVERVLTLLKHLDCQILTGSSPLRDDYALFARDIKKKLAHLAQHLSVPTPHLL